MEVVTQDHICDRIRESYTYMQMSVCTTDEVGISSVDCTNVNFLVLTPYCSRVRC